MMKNLFRPGDTKNHTYVVSDKDLAAFNGEVVHPVCSTFTLAREMEWAGRLFVLEMIEPGEEGIGTYVNVRHKSAAGTGEALILTSEFVSGDEKGNIHCKVSVATAEGRLVAVGETGQRIMDKTEIEKRISG